MALPAGVTTATVTVGVPVTHTGGEVKTFVSIEPSAFLVHAETGTPLVDFLEELAINEGVAGQFTLPHTDQAGFTDDSGNAYTNWYYTARVTYSTPSKAKNKAPKIKVFQLTTGQTVVDLDKLPGGAPALPYTAPTAKVDAFMGRTGAVTLLESDLPERLSEGELNATIATTGAEHFARPNLNTVVILGDSITQQNAIQGDYSGAGLGTMTGYSARGPWTVAAALLGHRMKLLGNLGVGGDTAQMIAARVPSVLALRPGWAVVGAGRNSVSAGDSAATIIGVLRDSIYTPILQDGTRVVATTITPRDGDTSAQRQVLNDVNAWMKEYARQTPGVVLADYYSAVTDGTTAAWIAGYVSDGLHPIVRGAGAMGKVLAAALSPVVPYVDTLVSNNADSGAYIVNPLMTGTGGVNAVGAALTGTIAANWTVQGGFTGTIVASKVARTDGKPGEWQQFNFTAPGTNRIQFRPSANITTFATGDKVYCEVEYETDAGFIPSTGYFNLVMYCYNGTTASVSVSDNYNGSLDPSGAENRLSSGTLRTPVMTVPAGTTYATFWVQLAGSGGAVRVSRCAPRKEITI